MRTITALAISLIMASCNPTEMEGTWVSADAVLFDRLEFNGASTVTICNCYTTSYVKEGDYIRVKTNTSDLLYKRIDDNTLIGEGFGSGTFKKVNAAELKNFDEKRNAEMQKPLPKKPKRLEYIQGVGKVGNSNNNSGGKVESIKYASFTKEEQQSMVIVRISTPIFPAILCEYLNIDETLFEKWNQDYDLFWTGEYPTEFYSLRIPKEKLDLFVQKKQELIDVSSEMCSH